MRLPCRCQSYSSYINNRKRNGNTAKGNDLAWLEPRLVIQLVFSSFTAARSACLPVSLRFSFYLSSLCASVTCVVNVSELTRKPMSHTWWSTTLLWLWILEARWDGVGLVANFTRVVWLIFFKINFRFSIFSIKLDLMFVIRSLLFTVCIYLTHFCVRFYARQCHSAPFCHPPANSCCDASWTKTYTLPTDKLQYSGEVCVCSVCAGSYNEFNEYVMTHLRLEERFKAQSVKPIRKEMSQVVVCVFR